MSRTERALQALYDYLSVNMLSHIQQYGGIFTLINDVNFAFGLPDLRRATQMPLVAVDLDTYELTQLTLGTPGTSKRRITIPANIHCFCAGREREPLFRQLIQLIDAIITLLETKPQHQEYVYQSPRLVDLTPPIETESHAPYLTAATISLNIQQIVTSTQP